MFTLGDLKLHSLNGGNFRLDGGAMHGVVPKTIWSRLVSCDERNRCAYSTRCLLVETAGQRVLIETGNGDKFSPKLKDIYGIDHDRAVGHALAEIGLSPDDIDVVIMTHLHFDHAGGTTRRAQDGTVPGREGAHEPVFRRARHVIQAIEWHEATHPHERNRASYLAENLRPLEEARLLHLVDGEAEVAPGVRVLPTPGHTAGHQSILLGSHDGPKALFLGDTVPTALHTRLPFIMAYDTEPIRNLETKRALFERSVREEWLLLWGHDPDHVGGRLRVDADGKFEIRELVDF